MKRIIKADQDLGKRTDYCVAIKYKYSTFDEFVEAYNEDEAKDLALDRVSTNLTVTDNIQVGPNTWDITIGYDDGVLNQEDTYTIESDTEDNAIVEALNQAASNNLEVVDVEEQYDMLLKPSVYSSIVSYFNAKEDSIEADYEDYKNKYGLYDTSFLKFLCDNKDEYFRERVLRTAGTDEEDRAKALEYLNNMTEETFEDLLFS